VGIALPGFGGRARHRWAVEVLLIGIGTLMVLAKLEHFVRQLLLCEPRQSLSATLLRRINPDLSTQLASAHQLWIFAYHSAARADPAQRPWACLVSAPGFRHAAGYAVTSLAPDA
jgi:hypothetical protein